MAKTKTVRQEAWAVVDKEGELVKCYYHYLITPEKEEAQSAQEEDQIVRPVTISWEEE